MTGVPAGLARATAGRLRTAAALVLVVGLAGCAGTHPARIGAPAVPPAAPAAASGTATASPAARPAARPAAPGPSASARMVCSDEIRTAVATLVGLPTPPARRTSWAPPVFRCTYQLPAGPLVASVREAGSSAAARRLLDAGRRATPGAERLPVVQGLGLPAYSAPDGTVVFAKDDTTLTVDPSGLPATVGTSARTRADLAYTVATDVLGCWSGA